MDSRALAGANLRVCDGGGGIRQVEIHLIPVKHASKAQAADAGEGQNLIAGVGQGRGAADRQGFGIDVNCDGAIRAGGVVGVVAFEVHLHRLLTRIGRHSLAIGCDGHLIRAADARDVRHGELHVTRAVIGLVGGGHGDRQLLRGDVHLRSRIGRKHHIVVVVRFAVAYHVDIIRPDWLVRAHSSVFHGAVGMDAVHRVADQHRAAVIGVRVANLLCAIVFAVGHGKAYIQVDGIDAQSTRNDAHFVIILCVREEDVRDRHTPCGRFFIRAKCAPITVRIAEAKGRLIELQLVYQHSFRHTAGHRVLDIDVIQQVHIFRSIRTLIVHGKGIQRNRERRFLQFKGLRGSGRQRIVCSIVPCQLQKHLGLFVHCGVLVRDAHPRDARADIIALHHASQRRNRPVRSVHVLGAVVDVVTGIDICVEGLGVDGQRNFFFSRVVTLSGNGYSVFARVFHFSDIGRQGNFVILAFFQGVAIQLDLHALDLSIIGVVVQRDGRVCDVGGGDLQVKHCRLCRKGVIDEFVCLPCLISQVDDAGIGILFPCAHGGPRRIICRKRCLDGIIRAVCQGNRRTVTL